MMPEEKIETEKLKLFVEHLQNTLKRNRLRIPILPEVAGKVVSIVNDPDISLDDVVSLLEKDPVIAAHVIKVANSPIYSPTGNITNLKQASLRLGTSLLSEIALSVSLQSGIFILKGYVSMMKDILKHTMAASLFTREMFGLADADYDLLFLSALFHTVGMPIVVYHIDEYRKKSGLVITENEINVLINKFHKSYAENVLKKWAVSSDVLFVATKFDVDQDMTGLHFECGLLRISQSFAFWLFDDKYDIQELLESKDLVDLNIHPQNLESLINNKRWIKDRVEEMIKY